MLLAGPVFAPSANLLLRCDLVIPLKLIWRIKAVKDRSIDYRFRIFSKKDDGSRIQAAKGHMTTVFTQLDEKGELQSMNIPAEIRALITEAPADALARPPDLKTA